MGKGIWGQTSRNLGGTLPMSEDEAAKLEDNSYVQKIIREGKERQEILRKADSNKAKLDAKRAAAADLQSGSGRRPAKSSPMVNTTNQKDSGKGAGGQVAAGAQAVGAFATAMNNNTGEVDTGAQVGEGAATGAATGATVGAAWGGAGAGVGAAVGAVVGGTVGALKARAARKAAAIELHNKKLRKLAEIDEMKSQKMMLAYQGMSQAMQRSLRVPVLSV